MSFLLNTDTKRTNIGANRRDILEPDLEVGNLRPSRYFVISQQCFILTSHSLIRLHTVLSLIQDLSHE